MKTILSVLLLTCCLACTDHRQIKTLFGVKAIEPFAGYVVKSKTKIVVTNFWNSNYCVGDTVYRMIIYHDDRLYQVDFTKYDFDSYNLGDTIK